MHSNLGLSKANVIQPHATVKRLLVTLSPLLLVSLLSVIMLVACSPLSPQSLPSSEAKGWGVRGAQVPTPVSIPWPPPPTATSSPTPVLSRSSATAVILSDSEEPEQSRSPERNEGEGSAKGAPITRVESTRPRCDGFGVEGVTVSHPLTPLPPSVDSVASQANRQPARVIRIVDGDTIEVELVLSVRVDAEGIAGQRHKLRYIGIDTPETYREVECFGHEATEKNRELVEGKTVYLEKDVSETDRYGRLLRFVYLEDDTFVNAELVRLGYAQVTTYPPDVKHADLFLQLQRQARQAGRGLWSQCE